MGAAALVAVVVLDVIVAAALFEVFKLVNRGLSMMAAWFRLAYSAVFLVAICRLFGVLLIIAGLGYLADGFATILVADFPFSFAVFVFGGEVALIFWLLIRGRQVRVPAVSSPIPGNDMP
jgi:hypothetical protein